MTGRPCSTCGTPSVRALGTRDYCAAHLAAFYRDCVSPATWAWRGGGIGLPVAERADYGPGSWELVCVCCGAGWVGPMFDPCSWCADALQRQRARQRARLLRPDPGGNADAVRARVARLADAAEAGLITADEARRAVARLTPEGAQIA